MKHKLFFTLGMAAVLTVASPLLAQSKGTLLVTPPPTQNQTTATPRPLNMNSRSSAQAYNRSLEKQRKAVNTHIASPFPAGFGGGFNLISPQERAAAQQRELQRQANRTAPQEPTNAPRQSTTLPAPMRDLTGSNPADKQMQFGAPSQTGGQAASPNTQTGAQNTPDGTGANSGANTGTNAGSYTPPSHLIQNPAQQNTGRTHNAPAKNPYIVVPGGGSDAPAPIHLRPR